MTMIKEDLGAKFRQWQKYDWKLLIWKQLRFTIYVQVNS